MDLVFASAGVSAPPLVAVRGGDAGLSPMGLGEDGSQVFISATVILIALTPVLLSIGQHLQSRLEQQPSAAT